MHDLEDFMQIAPEEARTENVLTDGHQLMLNRLSFELSERQRCATVGLSRAKYATYIATLSDWT